MEIPLPIKNLCKISTPYLSSKQIDLMFVEAIKAAIKWHKARSDFFSKILLQFNSSEDSINSINDCSNLPLIYANFFKTHVIKSINDNEIILTLTSSGTSGQKSQMFFDKWSIESARKMIDFIFDYNNWNQPEKLTNYLLFTYETLPDSKLGTAATDNYLVKFAKPNKIFYALRLTNINTPEHEFDLFGTIKTLQIYEKEGLPVRIFGFPSFMYFTLQRMAKLNLKPLKLNPESITLFGGGWKGHADKQIPKNELYAMIEYWLGIPEKNCRDGYGSVEHAIPYIECPHHNFHVPVWSRVFIRDVKTLKPLDFGNPGFLHFVTPYITSVPAISVLMGDLAVLYPSEKCGCGITTPYFEILGRAGTSANKSCAIAASELLERRKI